MSGCYLAVAMAAVSALELARKVGDLGQLLRPSFEVAQLDFARDELITDHHGEMSAVAIAIGVLEGAEREGIGVGDEAGVGPIVGVAVGVSIGVEVGVGIG